MARLTTDGERNVIGLYLEGFFYGLYSGTFAMYLHYQRSKNDNKKTRNIVFYCICSLYVLSVVVFACDIVSSIFEGSPNSSLPIFYIQNTSFGCCDFIAQFILIYRCWIVWGCNIRIVIIPSTLAFVFLATWLSSNGSAYILSDSLLSHGWGQSVLLTSLIMSLTVNALVTGLIVFRIFQVFQAVKDTPTLDDQKLGATGGSKLRHIIFILIESGMALFSIQLVRLVVTVVWPVEAAISALDIVAGIHAMLNGITPTIIVVRTSMGLSFDDEKSMEEVAIESLRFASNHLNSVSEAGSIDIVDQDSWSSDDIGIQRSRDIDDEYQ